MAVLESGIHATIAGVLLATTIPARTRIDPAAFLARRQALLADFARGSGGRYPDGAQQAAVRELEAACADVETPLQRLEHALHPWVAFVIIPLFALANAGVVLEGGLGAALGDRITLGIVLGLVVGKQIRITAAAWLATRLGLAALPAGVTWLHIYGMAWLGGIGFTMSLLIAGLAFADEALLTSAKIGILLASAIAGVVGFGLLRVLGRSSAAVHPGPSPTSEARPPVPSVG